MLKSFSTTRRPPCNSVHSHLGVGNLKSCVRPRVIINLDDDLKRNARISRRCVITRAKGDEKDYYTILGVPRDADKKTIKSAYRKKARQFHPDVNKEKGAEETFKKISEAYEVLSDDNKKPIYDQYGEAGLKGSAGFGGAGAGDFSNPFDLFDTFFGGMGGFSRGGAGGAGGEQRFRPIPGEDDRFDLQIDFREAVFGCEKDISIEHLGKCGQCSGNGMKSGTSSSSCTSCGGTGQQVQATRTPLGIFQQVTACPRCEGTGVSFTRCERCNGDGRVRETKNIVVKIPAGVDHGSRLRIRGEGNAGRRGGPPGDLYVFLSVREHPELRRDGINIHSHVEVNYLDAILGTTVQVTTVDGATELKVPAGTQPHTILLMAKKGVPRLGSPQLRGDHLVQLRVRLPSRLGSEERRLIEALKALASPSTAGAGAAANGGAKPAAGAKGATSSASSTSPSPSSSTSPSSSSSAVGDAKESGSSGANSSGKTERRKSGGLFSKK